MKASSALLMSLCVVSAACKPTATSKQVVNIGGLTDQTGSLAAPSRFDAIRLAVSDFNSALVKAKGYQELVFSPQLVDSQNDPTVATPRGIALVVDAGCKAIISDSSNDSNALNLLAYTAADAGGIALSVPIIGIDTTSANINNPNFPADAGSPAQVAAYHNDQHWLFRTVMALTDEAAIMVRLLGASPGGDVNGDGKLTVALLGGNEPFGQSFVKYLTADVQASFPGATIEHVLMPAVVDPNVFSWTNAAGWMQDALDETSCGPCTQTDCQCAGGSAATVSATPDLIVAALYPQYAASMYAVSTAQAGTRVLQPHTFRFSSVLRQLAGKANGAEGVSFIVAQSNASGDAFKSEMKASYQVAEMWDAQAYDAATLIMLATVYAAHANKLEDASQVTGTQIRDALSHLNVEGAQVVRVGPAEFTKGIDAILAGTPINYDGASGPVDFDANGNVRDQFTHFTVKGGAFVDGEIYDCVADPVACPCIANGGSSCP